MKHRCLFIGLSSVAGERGRKANYVYGSSKAGLSAYLSGLRQRLAPQGIRVVTVEPGYVDTKMAAGMDLPGPLVSRRKGRPENVFRLEERQERNLRNLVLARDHIPGENGARTAF
ncbi:MAG: SDR family NAD(P)-dependent oxidoreductase [Balneolaceae bacterium]|nr:SDR family NAD(P)-dependent oxidoreductase [Balneolaceae bacterium]